MDLPFILNTALDCAKEAGIKLKQAFDLQKTFCHQVEFSVKEENDVNIVTKTDKEIQEFCFSFLKACFPLHSFIGEEDVYIPLTDEPTWIIDPIDGTTNFVHGFPFCCISIGFVVNKEPLVGVIYNPILDQLFYASKNHGAFLNGISLSEKSIKPMASFSKSLVTAEFGNERTSSNLDPKLRMIDRFIKAPSRGMRSIGSAALNMCLVAQGIFDVYFEFGIHSWDIAAGWIILSEAGGLSVNFFKENDTSELPRNERFDLCARNILCVRPGESIEAMEALIHESRKFLEKVPGYDRD